MSVALQQVACSLRYSQHWSCLVLVLSLQLPSEAYSLGSWVLTGSSPASIFHALGIWLSSSASYMQYRQAQRSMLQHKALVLH